MKQKILKQTLKRLVSDRLLGLYGRLVAPVRSFKYGKMPTQAVFQKIYRENRWGGDEGTFYSGPGSTERFAGPYVDLVCGLIGESRAHSVVDLGCGDFQVGRAIVQSAPDSLSYLGVDIVPELIAEHKRWLAAQSEALRARVDFMHADLVGDPLPKGDVCLIRQVLQHLSNEQIAGILPKLAAYRWVVVTEHYPADEATLRPNLDKAHGPDIRVHKHSAVCLDRPPFNIRGLDEKLSQPDGEAGCFKTFVVAGEQFAQ